jgi:uncharacterized protein YjbI with pentapeptide repeats
MDAPQARFNGRPRSLWLPASTIPLATPHSARLSSRRHQRELPTVTIDPEYHRLLWGIIALLVLAIALLAALLIRRSTLRLPGLGLHALQDTLGLAGLSRPLFLAGLTLWLVLLVLLTGGLLATIAGVVIRTIRIDTANTEPLRLTLLSLAALTATLGALIALPYSSLRARNDARQTRATEDGLITDRINKAIEGLGAEMKVDRIGRPVTVWTGKPSRDTRDVVDVTSFELPSRSREVRREFKDIVVNALAGTSKLGWSITFDTWPTEETRIEWRDTPFPLAPDEVIATPGDWQVFSESLPNLEVRIGAILALERLARQNLDVHVQIMEILTAYIRENAKAEDAPKLPEAPEYAEESYEEWRMAFAEWEEALSQALTGIRPREDVQIALSVIGRRSPEQRLAEARWQNPDPSARFSFDDPFPPYLDMNDVGYDATAHENWHKNYGAWIERIGAYSGYRIDLCRTNLRRADLSQLHLAGALFNGAQMQQASFIMTNMQGTKLRRVQLQGAQLRLVQMQGAMFDASQLQGTRWFEARLHGLWINDSNMQGATLFGAQLQVSRLSSVHLQAALFGLAHMQGAQVSNSDLRVADLQRVQMQRVLLENVNFDDTTDFRGVSLKYAGLHYLDLVRYPLLFSQLAPHFPTLFADASVRLADDHPRPAHWPTWKLDWDTYHSEYAKWLASPSTYTPIPPPA